MRGHLAAGEAPDGRESYCRRQGEGLTARQRSESGWRAGRHHHRWPLYTYVSDTSAGQAKSQALNLNGGLWYVLAPSGRVIRTKP